MKQYLPEASFTKIAGLTYEEGVEYSDGNENLREKERSGCFKAKNHRVGHKGGAKLE